LKRVLTKILLVLKKLPPKLSIFIVVVKAVSLIKL
jgi:hypothetical protein